MTPLQEAQHELTRLIGKKDKYLGEYPETNSTPHLSDFHRWMNEKEMEWSQCGKYVNINDGHPYYDVTALPYDSSKDLLDQDEETLSQIVELIKNNQ